MTVLLPPAPQQIRPMFEPALGFWDGSACQKASFVCSPTTCCPVK